MGTVFRGRDPMIDREVAVKTIRLQGFAPGETEGFRERFFREAQAAGKLSHPGIVTIYDVGVDETARTPFIVMELIAGRTLLSLVDASPAPLPVGETLGLVKQIAEALDYAHSAGIVHRDIKPANIIVTPAGRAIITDFGVARLRKSQVTVQGEMIGTPAFMSPEQVRGERVDGRADLFSLGVILYWMLTLEKPFTGELADLMFKIVYSAPAPPSALNPTLRPDFDAVIARALAKPRESRYQTGDEFAGDLDCLLSGQPPHAPVPAVAVPAAEQTMRLLPPEPSATLPRSAGPRERASDLATSLLGRVRTWSTRRKQVALLVAVLALLALVLWAFLPAAQSVLAISLQHNFRAGAVSVWVDDRLVLEENLVHDEVRRVPFSAPRYVGRFSASVMIRAGERTIRVRVNSPDASYDEVRELSGTFPKDGDRALSVLCDTRKNSLTLSLR